MAFRDMSLDELVSLLGPWVNDKGKKAAFLAVPDLVSLHAQLARAYDACLRAQPKPKTPNAELTALYAEETRVDKRHDLFARSSEARLFAQQLHHLARGEADKAQAIGELIVAIEVDDMTFVSSSYRAESGKGQRVQVRLDGDPTLVKQLEKVPFEKGASVADDVDGWLASAKELGDLEDKKEALLRALGEAAPAPRAVSTARDRAARLCNRLVDTLADSEADEALIAPIRDRLVDAASRAGARAPAPSPEPAPGPDPTPGGGSAPGGGPAAPKT